MKPAAGLAIVAIFFLVSGCKSKKAADYSNMIAEKENQLAPWIEETKKKVANYFATEEYDSLVGIGSRMESKVDSVIRELKNKPAPNAKQGEAFKKAAVRYFEYLKSIYTSYKNYGLQTDPFGRLNEQERMSIIVSQEQVMGDYLKEAQRRFAQANGFKIKNKS